MNAEEFQKMYDRENEMGHRAHTGSHPIGENTCDGPDCWCHNQQTRLGDGIIARLNELDIRVQKLEHQPDPEREIMSEVIGEVQRVGTAIFSVADSIDRWVRAYREANGLDPEDDGRSIPTRRRRFRR